MFGYKKFRKLQDGIIEAILKIEESLLNKIVEVDLRLSKRMNNIDCLDEQETEEAQTIEIKGKAKLFAIGYLGGLGADIRRVTIYEPVLTPEDISRGYKPIVEFTFKQ